jgi:hypothetical protein
MSEFSEMSVKNIRLILKERGISTQGMLERSELEEALRSSTPSPAAAGGGGAAAAPAEEVIRRGNSAVRVVFLAERHYDDKCDVKNIRLIKDFLNERKNVPASSVLFVSEGNKINPCYEGLGIRPEQMILEYTSWPTFHYLQLFMLSTQQFEDTLDRHNPSSKKELMITALSAANILVKIPNNEGMRLIQQLIDLASAGNIPGYAALIMRVYELILEHAFNGETPREKEFLQGLVRSMLEHNGRFAYALSENGPLEKIFNRREKAIIAKMEQRVKADDSISTVVIIFGRFHYKNFKKLLASSPLFLLDDSLSNITVSNGRNANNISNNRNKRATKIAEARARGQRKARRKRSTRKK